MTVSTIKWFNIYNDVIFNDILYYIVLETVDYHLKTWVQDDSIPHLQSMIRYESCQL